MLTVGQGAGAKLLCCVLRNFLRERFLFFKQSRGERHLRDGLALFRTCRQAGSRRNVQAHLPKRRTSYSLVWKPNVVRHFYRTRTSHAGGGWRRDLLNADWDELEKNIAPEVLVKSVESQEVQVELHFYFFFVLMDPVNKKDTSSHDLYAIHSIRKMKRNATLDADDALPTTPLSVKREATGDRDDVWSMSGDYIYPSSLCILRSSCMLRQQPTWPARELV